MSDLFHEAVPDAFILDVFDVMARARWHVFQVITKRTARLVSLEPKVIVPMHWSGIGAPKALDAFLKEAGNGSEKIDKLTLKKKDLAGLEGSILVLTP